ncbi:MAG TPA: YdiU family protein [Actinomycetales bacterium]|nr:YdiU family protein [Actinomycetales bacterium]
MSQPNEPTTTPDLPVRLTTHFTDALPELTIEWQAEAFPAPELVAVNEPLARELGIDPEWLRTADGVAFLMGRSLPPGAAPTAQAYSGHQFGHFVPVLGDGRALLLGEITDTAGNLRDIHLKGSGPTPFARRGDGHAALGPMLREFITGEAMHALGIPTTRSLAVLTTGRTIVRTRPQPGAIVVRVASSHLRVGSFQFARMHGGDDVVKRLADYAIGRHYPRLADIDDAPERYRAFAREVVAAQARLVAEWMGVGFIHGVLNTDNITITGETIDYGPCAFLDKHDPATFFSFVDRQGRYAYGNQPAMTQWGLARFLETLIPLLATDPNDGLAAAEDILASFVDTYRDAERRVWLRKLGLGATSHSSPTSVSSPSSASSLSSPPSPPSLSLADDWRSLLVAHQPDHTLVHRALADAARTGDITELAGYFEGADGTSDAPGAESPSSESRSSESPSIESQSSETPSSRAWAREWLAANPNADDIAAANPIYIPRNHLVEEALTAADDGDYAPFHDLYRRVTNPYDPAPTDSGDATTDHIPAASAGSGDNAGSIPAASAGSGDTAGSIPTIDASSLDRYALPSPDGMDGYTTFCGT